MKRVLIIVIVLSLSLLAKGQDVSKHREQKRKLEQEIAYIDKQLSNTKTQQRASTEQLSLTQKRIDNRKKLISELDAEIDTYDEAISLKTLEISHLQTRLDTLEIYYQRLIQTVYRNRDPKIWIMYILASENVSQGYRRFSYLRNLAGSIEVQAERIRETGEVISDERENLKILKQTSIESRQAREHEFKQLTSEEISLKRSIDQLKRNEKDYRKELQRKKEEADELNKEIERILAEAMRQQQKGIQIDHKLSEKFENNKGKLPWPITRGIIVEKYGQHNHPVFTDVKLPFNNGINVSTELNAEVYCVFDGVVKQVLVMPGYNQCVLVQHGAYYTFYCKLSKVSVKAGQKLAIGDIIGILDEAQDNNSILHFEVWKGTTKQNPEQWLSRK